MARLPAGSPLEGDGQTVPDASTRVFQFGFPSRPEDVTVHVNGERVDPSLYVVAIQPSGAGGTVTFPRRPQVPAPQPLAQGDTVRIGRDTVVRRSTGFRDGLAQASAVELHAAYVQRVLEEVVDQLRRHNSVIVNVQGIRGFALDGGPGVDLDDMDEAARRTIEGSAVTMQLEDERRLVLRDHNGSILVSVDIGEVHEVGTHTWARNSADDAAVKAALDAILQLPALRTMAGNNALAIHGNSANIRTNTQAIEDEGARIDALENGQEAVRRDQLIGTAAQRIVVSDTNTWYALNGTLPAGWETDTTSLFSVLVRELPEDDAKHSWKLSDLAARTRVVRSGVSATAPANQALTFDGAGSEHFLFGADSSGDWYFASRQRGTYFVSGWVGRLLAGVAAQDKDGNALGQVTTVKASDSVDLAFSNGVLTVTSLATGLPAGGSDGEFLGRVAGEPAWVPAPAGTGGTPAPAVTSWRNDGVRSAVRAAQTGAADSFPVDTSTPPNPTWATLATATLTSAQSGEVMVVARGEGIVPRTTTDNRRTYCQFRVVRTRGSTPTVLLTSTDYARHIGPGDYGATSDIADAVMAVPDLAEAGDVYTLEVRGLVQSVANVQIAYAEDTNKLWVLSRGGAGGTGLSREEVLGIVLDEEAKFAPDTVLADGSVSFTLSGDEYALAENLDFAIRGTQWRLNMGDTLYDAGDDTMSWEFSKRSGGNITQEEWDTLMRFHMQLGADFRRALSSSVVLNSGVGETEGNGEWRDVTENPVANGAVNSVFLREPVGPENLLPGGGTVNQYPAATNSSGGREWRSPATEAQMNAGTPGVLVDAAQAKRYADAEAAASGRSSFRREQALAADLAIGFKALSSTGDTWSDWQDLASITVGLGEVGLVSLTAKMDMEMTSNNQRPLVETRIYRERTGGNLELGMTQAYVRNLTGSFRNDVWESASQNSAVTFSVSDEAESGDVYKVQGRAITESASGAIPTGNWKAATCAIAIASMGGLKGDKGDAGLEVETYTEAAFGSVTRRNGVLYVIT